MFVRSYSFHVSHQYTLHVIIISGETTHRRCLVNKASHQAELLSLAIDLTNFNFVFIPRKHIIMESRDSQIVPVHSVPHTSDIVLSSGVQQSGVSQAEREY